MNMNINMYKNEKSAVRHSINVNNKRHDYVIWKKSKNTTFVECEAANLAQEFLNEDVPELLNDLPNLILAEREYKEQQNQVIRFRVSPEDKKKIEAKALKNGYSSTSSFLRDLALKC